jgi:hypothetical protein
MIPQNRLPYPIVLWPLSGCPQRPFKDNRTTVGAVCGTSSAYLQRTHH